MARKVETAEVPVAAYNMSPDRPTRPVNMTNAWSPVVVDTDPSSGSALLLINHNPKEPIVSKTPPDIPKILGKVQMP